MRNTQKVLSALAAAALTVATLAGCSGGTSAGGEAPQGGDAAQEATQGGTYTISEHYTDNISELPEDAVNQVMFAYSEGDANLTVSATLTLDPSDMTYTLQKQMLSGESEEDANFNGQWEFTGTYRQEGDDENSVVLEVPESGRCNVYYPTVLNYQSIEQQTQDWVDSSENPALLTRFNKWYPSKAETVVEQPVTLEGDTMTFGDVEL